MSTNVKRATTKGLLPDYYSKLKTHVDHNTLICAYNALVLPHFDYCCEVWNTINLTLCNRLQKLQNRAATIIVGRTNKHGQSELALA